MSKALKAPPSLFGIGVKSLSESDLALQAVLKVVRVRLEVRIPWSS